MITLRGTTRYVELELPHIIILIKNHQGYPTTMIFEAVTGNDNGVIHSSSDTITYSGFSWSHSLEFAKVALGFVYELSA